MHLGTSLHFGCQVDAMRLSRTEADVDWPAAPGLAATALARQAEVDRVRAHFAVDLLGPRDQGRDAVAQPLGYFDGANFRRSFKRWTGVAPGDWASG